MIRRPNTPSADALCCCEYINSKGEHAHLVTCCCDCEALDSAFDSCFRCQPVSEELCDKVLATVGDRCRLPWCSGKGAVRVKLEVVVPLVAVPCSLLLAAFSALCTALVLGGTPLLLLLTHRLWARHTKRRRTRLFYLWGLTSTVCMYYVFEFVVIPFREILLWENLLLSTLFAAMCYALYHAKKDPGTLTAREHNKHGSDDSQAVHPATQAGGPGAADVMPGPTAAFMVNSMGYSESEVKLMAADMNKEQLRELKHSLPADQVTWVDSRPIVEGRLRTWCKQCRLHRPVRCGHCPICDVCVRQRDHHCVWIDSCVGAHNHRSFLLALLLFLLCGAYGCHLTLTTVCTPEMYLDWFLVPADCRFVYADLPTALAFVSACYSAMILVIMTATCVNQAFLITQNITSQELHSAGLRGWLRGGFWARNNPYNRGVLRNWKDFLLGRRMRVPDTFTPAQRVDLL